MCESKGPRRVGDGLDDQREAMLACVAPREQRESESVESEMRCICVNLTESRDRHTHRALEPSSTRALLKISLSNQATA